MKATKPVMLIIIGAILLLLHFISFHIFTNHSVSLGLLIVGVSLVAYGGYLSLRRQPTSLHT